MSNLYGITLDCAWIAWAAKERVSETVAAAVLLICQNRPAHEVVAKLTPWEFERVVDIVRRSPGHFPFGTLAALKSRDPIPARLPAADSVQADQAPRQSSRPETGKERGSIGNDALKALGNVAAERPLRASRPARLPIVRSGGIGVHLPNWVRRPNEPDLLNAPIAMASLSTPGPPTPKKPGHTPGRSPIFFDGAWSSKI